MRWVSVASAGATVSSFPAWFGEPRRSESDPFTYCRICVAPFTLAPGGYMGIVYPDGTVAQVTARKNPYAAAHREQPAVGSRRWRRWQKLAAVTSASHAE